MTNQMMTLWEKPVVAGFAIVIEDSFGPNYEPCQIGEATMIVQALSQLAILMSGS
jgi:hypothetical protein